MAGFRYWHASGFCLRLVKIGLVLPILLLITSRCFFLTVLYFVSKGCAFYSKPEVIVFKVSRDFASLPYTTPEWESSSCEDLQTVRPTNRPTHGPTDDSPMTDRRPTDRPTNRATTKRPTDDPPTVRCSCRRTKRLTSWLFLFQDFDVGKTYRKKVVLTNISYTQNFCKYVQMSDELKDFIEVSYVSVVCRTTDSSCTLLEGNEPMNETNERTERNEPVQCFPEAKRHRGNTVFFYRAVTSIVCQPLLQKIPNSSAVFIARFFGEYNLYVSCCSFDPPGVMSAGLTCDFVVTFRPMVSAFSMNRW